MAGLIEFLGKLQGDLANAYTDSRLAGTFRQQDRQRERSLQALQQTGALNAYGAGAPQMAEMLSSSDPAVQALFQARYQQYADQASPQTKLALEIQRQQLANARTGAQRDAETYAYNRSQRPAEERRSALQERLLGAQLDMATAQGDSARTADQLGAIRFMSDKYQTNMKAPVEVADAVQQIDGSLKVGNSLGGLAAVIKLAKILDPTSVVREGEVTTVEGGIGTAQSLISTFNRLFSKGWSPEAAKQFDAVVKQVAGPILQRGLRLNQEYATLAGQFEVNPEVVVTGVGFPTGYVTRWLSGVPDPEVETTY